MLDESLVSLHSPKAQTGIRLFRITGEPLFGSSADGLVYSEQFGFGNSNEPSPLSVQDGVVGFDFRAHAAGLGSVLSTAVGHQQILHGAAGFNPNESDDDLSEDYDDIDDDEQSNGDDSSPGELDE